MSQAQSYVQEYSLHNKKYVLPVRQNAYGWRYVPASGFISIRLQSAEQLSACTSGDDDIQENSQVYYSTQPHPFYHRSHILLRTQVPWESKRYGDWSQLTAPARKFRSNTIHVSFWVEPVMWRWKRRGGFPSRTWSTIRFLTLLSSGCHGKERKWGTWWSTFSLRR